MTVPMMRVSWQYVLAWLAAEVVVEKRREVQWKRRRLSGQRPMRSAP